MQVVTVQNIWRLRCKLQQMLRPGIFEILLPARDLQRAARLADGVRHPPQSAGAFEFALQRLEQIANLDPGSGPGIAVAIVINLQHVRIAATLSTDRQPRVMTRVAVGVE